LVSVIVPTLNSANILEECLDSIKRQKYKNIEIIIADGGSTDTTLALAKKHHCHLVKNPLITAESAKAVGLKHAHGDYVAFIDSDNILPTSNWLTEMITPLESDTTLIGSEPWEFTYRSEAGFIERYSALIGANDPYAYIVGISDRRNVINHQWTSIDLPQQDFKDYLRIKLMPNRPIPTIGANGTVFRSTFLKNNFSSDYLFDIDIITQTLDSTQKPLYFAKTKNGIIHTYCESSILKFYKKQMRRLKDYFQFKSIRKFNYKNDFNHSSLHNLQVLAKNNLKFVLHTILIFPMFITLIKGITRKPDIAWLFHPIACLITLYCYVYISTIFLLGYNVTQSRHQWKQ